MTHGPAATEERARPHVAALVALGVAAGYLSGLFGVGGGVLVVPALLLLGVDQRRASGASVAAILPTSVVGAIGYGLAGQVDPIVALLLAVGVVGGAQLGTFLLARLPVGILFWGFIVLLVLVAVSLWVNIPQRDDRIELSLLAGAAIVLCGLVVGILSGMFGVGGGIIAVPALMFLFGASDLVAKGTSLVMMVPGSLSATVGNARRRKVDLAMAALIGVPACLVSPLGILTATVIPPLASNLAFSALVVVVIAQLVTRELRRRRAARAS